VLDHSRTWIVAALVLLVAAWLVAPYVRSAAFILDLAGTGGWARRLMPVRVRPVTARDVQVPTRYGDEPARVYEPAGGSTRSLIVFPGVHAGGIDEPRLVAFSRRLASTGANVLSMPLPDLREFRITPRSTDVIEDATLWLAANRALAPSGRVGLVGVSFAGGLALVAAGRESLAGKVQLVVSLGGHADLPRVMTYLCTGVLPDGTTRTPHAYGIVLILIGALDHLVPAEQVEPLRAAILTFLEASSYDQTDVPKSKELFDLARARTAELPEPARTYMQWVNDRNAAALGEKLLPLVETLGGAPALSPDRSRATAAPAFLLHGAADNVIPSTETPLAAAYLASHGNAGTKWLLTPLLTHATLSEDVAAADVWQLVRFWKEMLDAAR
jgi:dienelactone hydrolase